MSPNRRMSTSFSSRQRRNEQKRAAESLARKQSSDLDEKSERPSELDLHPSAVSTNSPMSRLFLSLRVHSLRTRRLL